MRTRRTRQSGRLNMGYCGFYRSGCCPLAKGRYQPRPKIPHRNSADDFIYIPPAVRGWEPSRFSISTRLQHLLGQHEYRVLGDLHGVKPSDLFVCRGWGKVSLLELLALVRDVQEGNWANWRDPNSAGAGDYYQI